MDISEIRRKNLSRLLRERFDGKQVNLADALERQPGYISRCLSTGKHRKRIGEDFARHIEKVVGLEMGWLDRTSHSPSEDTPANHQPQEQNTHDVEARALSLEGLVTPRSSMALQHIIQAAREGRISEEDLLMLEQIAKRFATDTSNNEPKHNNPHERLKNKLGKDDLPTES